MKDTNHPDPGTARTEGDGISYKGLVWSMITLTIITLFCYALVVGLFKFLDSRAAAGDTNRSPLAAAPVPPAIVDGRVVGSATAPVPSLLVGEPVNLKKFRDHEEEILTTYGWVDQNAGVVRLPIDRAKALLLQRGIPVREARQ
jgi:hypothetical protein